MCACVPLYSNKNFPIIIRICDFDLAVTIFFLSLWGSIKMQILLKRRNTTKLCLDFQHSFTSRTDFLTWKWLEKVKTGGKKAACTRSQKFFRLAIPESFHGCWRGQISAQRKCQASKAEYEQRRGAETPVSRNWNLSGWLRSVCQPANVTQTPEIFHTYCAGTFRGLQWVFIFVW